ncbi:MAG TPA: glycosyltransferase family 4 protein [Tepidisphaeraceae bacterium]|nr:glycosyltransferase family 4 protein [Tepidisphaeraceae bacterium]
MTDRSLADLLALPAVLFLSAVGSVIRYRHVRQIGLPSKALDADGPRPLKVLFLTRDLPFHGGVARCVRYLVGACDPRRVELYVASLIDPCESMTAEFVEFGITPVVLGDVGCIGPSRRLARFVREHGIDVVVATTFKTYLVAKLGMKRSGGRVVFWLHAIDGVVQGPVRRAMFHQLARRDPLMFVSRAVREANIPPGHTGPEAVIHNGVEDVEETAGHEPYAREKLAEFGVPCNAIVLAYVAEFVEWKDHATLIKAVEKLAEQGRDVHALLIGRGRLMERMKKSSAALPHGGRIHFLGPRNDVRRLLGVTDIYVHCARAEGFGLSLVEAMLARRPVVAAAAGALVEYVIPGVNGELFKPGDAADLAEKINQLMADEPRARRLGEAAREYCLKEFGIDHFADCACDFLEEVSNRRRAPGEVLSR